MNNLCHTIHSVQQCHNTSNNLCSTSTTFCKDSAVIEKLEKLEEIPASNSSATVQSVVTNVAINESERLDQNVSVTPKETYPFPLQCLYPTPQQIIPVCCKLAFCYFATLVHLTINRDRIEQLYSCLTTV